ncbi:MAG: transporter, partial [Aeromicrobium sp.]|nr:transporter [Aeromicrobium sp.]
DGRTPNAANQALAAVHSYTTVFWWAAAIFTVGAFICGALLPRGPIVVDPDAAPVMAH